MAFGDRHLAFALAGPHSVGVSMGTGASKQTTRGILNAQREAMGADGMLYQVPETTLTIATGALTGVAEDSTLTADGTSYVVRQITRSADGRWLDLMLAKVT